MSDDESPLVARIRELEATSAERLALWEAERTRLEGRIAEAEHAASGHAINLNDVTLAAVGNLERQTQAWFADAEARSVARTRRARVLARRSSAEARAFWGALGIVGVVAVLVGLGKIAADAFVTTALALAGGVAALVVRNQSVTKKEEEEEDRESLPPPPPLSPN